LLSNSTTQTNAAPERRSPSRLRRDVYGRCRPTVRAAVPGPRSRARCHAIVSLYSMLRLSDVQRWGDGAGVRPSGKVSATTNANARFGSGNRGGRGVGRRPHQKTGPLGSPGEARGLSSKCWRRSIGWGSTCGLTAAGVSMRSPENRRASISISTSPSISTTCRGSRRCWATSAFDTTGQSSQDYPLASFSVTAVVGRSTFIHSSSIGRRRLATALRVRPRLGQLPGRTSTGNRNNRRSGGALPEP